MPRLPAAAEFLREHASPHLLCLQACPDAGGAYNSVLAPRRQACIGRSLRPRQRHSERLQEHCERLADHYERGAMWEKALEYLVAAQKAQQAYANQEALTYYDRALSRPTVWAYGCLPRCCGSMPARVSALPAQ